MFLQIVLLGITLFLETVNCESRTSPIYAYLKDLCPFGQFPLTGSKNVKMCTSLCPLGSLCFKGICCVPPPQCRHPSFRTSAGYPCMPHMKNNCPDGSHCVASSQEGMFICCSSKSVVNGFSITNTIARPSTNQSIGNLLGSRQRPQQPPVTEKPSSVISKLAADTTICPESHPIVAHNGKTLILCKDCHQGICSRFRSSSIEVCCQNSNDICGPGSQVLMDGYVPRDCSTKPCGKGYECSLTPSGVHVCCSLARCPNGVFARSVCAAGCLRSEKCVAIQDEMWCCPSIPEARNSAMQCSGTSISTGELCDPAFPLCPSDSDCEINLAKTQHICCRKKRQNKTLVSRTRGQTRQLTTTTTTMSTPEQPEDEKILSCLDGSEALFHNGLSVMCPRLDDPCPAAGFVCQESDIHDVFVCCSSHSEYKLPEPPLIAPTTALAITQTTEKSILEPEHPNQQNISPSCPFSYNPSSNDKNGEVQRCLTLFSLDCPFGYTCLPSSTTDSYLCCIRKPLI